MSCRVLEVAKNTKSTAIEVSLRATRMTGKLLDDKLPEVGSIVPAYVTSTNKKGCFLRISRQIEGRATLTELCDEFLPNPSASFPPGRLVAGRVKSVRKVTKSEVAQRFHVDLDMRESVLGTRSENQVKFENIEVGSVYSGRVTRIEEYGAFVRILNSGVIGLVHKSECSDNFVANVDSLYQPGNLVKVKVITKIPEKRQIGFSMKASHFVSAGEGDSCGDDGGGNPIAAEMDAMDLDSDDDNFVRNLEGLQSFSSRTHEEDDDSKTSGSDSDTDTDSSSSEDECDAPCEKYTPFDTDVGFDWSGSSIRQPLEVNREETSEDESDDDEAEQGSEKVTGKRSRKKQADRRKEEKKIARREASLADGTADENPETVADFERLLTSQPNSSEVWMRYMAFHLSLADVNSARETANRAFDRIEFRLEKEKLNVWCALLALELKFGNEASLQEAITRASRNNNPKQVHLRLCELLENEVMRTQSPADFERANSMHLKGCKKFRSKKKVWMAYMEFLLKHSRAEESFELSKRALKSLKPHKHVETMSKFAQLMFQYGDVEKARTLFDGLLQSNRKRLDLLFVYLDKEVKHGDVVLGRKLLERAASLEDNSIPMKLNDKQMKRLFKKWYAFEQEHGSEDNQYQVKEAAQRFIQQTS